MKMEKIKKKIATLKKELFEAEERAVALDEELQASKARTGAVSFYKDKF